MNKDELVEYYAKRTKSAESYIIRQNKRIAELEEQIEKMKLCQNCKFEDCDYLEEPCSVCSRCLGDIKRKGNFDKWEIKE